MGLFCFYSFLVYFCLLASHLHTSAPVPLSLRLRTVGLGQVIQEIFTAVLFFSQMCNDLYFLRFGLFRRFDSVGVADWVWEAGLLFDSVLIRLFLCFSSASYQVLS